MSVVLVFILVVLGLGLWWLSQQRLLSKPWLETGVVAARPETTGLPTPKIALVVGLAVIGALFALFASAAFMRMEFDDWRPVPLPSIIWLNTALLLLASVALRTALAAKARRDGPSLRLALVTATVATLAFLLGQATAWAALVSTGVLITTNPAHSFFYLLTGLHALHILAGLAATAWAASVALRRTGPSRLALELCATYADFLLLVWAGLLLILTGAAEDVIAICRQILT